VLPSTCRVQRKLSTSFWRASPWFFNVGRAIKTWLYMGMYAVLRRSDRCSRSVGGVVANILLLRAFGSICYLAFLIFSACLIISCDGILPEKPWIHLKLPMCEIFYLLDFRIFTSLRLSGRNINLLLKYFGVHSGAQSSLGVYSAYYKRKNYFS
jgi:hypothetical protein